MSNIFIFFFVLILFFRTGVQPCGEYCDGEDDTWDFLTGNTNAVVQNQFVGCSSSPCQNGCTCQPSCQDENDYVCVPPAGNFNSCFSCRIVGLPREFQVASRPKVNCRELRWFEARFKAYYLIVLFRITWSLDHLNITRYNDFINQPIFFSFNILKLKCCYFF